MRQTLVVTVYSILIMMLLVGSIYMKASFTHKISYLTENVSASTIENAEGIPSENIILKGCF